MAAAARAFQRVSQKGSALFICDIQDKFRATVQHFDGIVNVSKRMIDTANTLDIPILATQQYPKGLGQLVSELGIDKDKVPVFDKTCFSMILPQVQEQLSKWQTSHVILCGIEAHACIYHTALDLVQQNMYVTVVADACASRSQVDRMFALRQLEQAGVFVSTSECVILSLLKGADHPKFRQVQKFIMESAPDTGLLQAKM